MGGKFTPPKLFYLRSSKPLTVWKNPQKYVNQLCLRRFCQIFSLFDAFSYDCVVKEVSQNRGISLYLLIKNRKITKTALKWAKTVKTTPNFHQRAKIIRIFEFKIFFGRGQFLRILGQFFQFCHFFWKTQK